MAGSLIETLSGDFDPSQYKDSYREALQQVIEAKVAGHEVVSPADAQPTSGTVVDLMAALRASVEAAKKGRPEAVAPAAAKDVAEDDAEDGPADDAPAKKAPASAGPRRPRRRRRRPPRRRPRRRRRRRSRRPAARRAARPSGPGAAPDRSARGRAAAGRRHYARRRCPAPPPRPAPLTTEPGLPGLFEAPERLARVRRLVGAVHDTTGLDRLTRLAALLLEAPCAQVSLIGEEQVVVAGAFGFVPERPGPDPAGTACAPSRCRAAAAAVVGDADAATRGCAACRRSSGARCAAYLGVPLRRHRGRRPGRAVRLRRGAAHLVAGPGRAARRAGASRWSPSWSCAPSASRRGGTRPGSTWRWTAPASAASTSTSRPSGCSWDDRLVRLFGYDRAVFSEHLDSFNDRLHPDDLERVGEAIATAVEQRGELSVEYRIVLPRRRAAVDRGARPGAGLAGRVGAADRRGVRQHRRCATRGTASPAPSRR